MIDKPRVAVRVDRLTKSFKIPLETSNGIKQKLINFIKGRKGYRVFTPLKDISFEINEGEFFGIVGRNGSGKSTLLKSIAGIYTPESGGVNVNGKLIPFIELGVGFNPELTGRENVLLNGALLGFSNQEMEEMYDEIVDFAELHEFMEERLKNYSSGMQVRLAFSIAIRAKGDILLLDEVLAVGDSAFQQKCYAYFNNLKEDGKTVILVTHSMGAVERFCDRALLLDKGKIKAIGDKSDIADMYEELFISSNAIQKHDQPESNKKTIATASVELLSKKSDDDRVKIGDDIDLLIKVTTTEDIKACNLGVNIRNENKLVVFSMDTQKHIGDFLLKKGKEKIIKISIKNYFTNGVYTVGAHIVDELKKEDAVLFMDKDILSISLYGVTTHDHSLFHAPYAVTGED